MDTAQIVVAVMWFFAAMVGGICGLGPAMMAVPVISFFVPIKTDILITCIIAPFASILLVLMHLRFCRWRSLIPFSWGSFRESRQVFTCFVSFLPGPLKS